MREIVLLGLLSSVLCSQQMNPIVEAFIRGQEARLESERLELERQKLELERQRIGLEHRRPARVSIDPRWVEHVVKETDQAFSRIYARFPDFRTYESEMPRLMDMVLPGSASAEQYLECLYLVAKFGSFSSLSTSSRTMARGKPMTNEDVIALVQAGIGDDIIIRRIGESSCQYRFDIGDLIKLRQNHVSDAVIRAMLAQPNDR